MSVVTIQVGQCGNQLGADLFNALHEHTMQASTPSQSAGHIAKDRTNGEVAAAAACRRAFFRGNQVSRAVVVDTEPTAIQRVVQAKWHETSHKPSSDPEQPREFVAGKNTGSVKGSRRIREVAWSYDRKTQVCCHAHGGAANNWAFGYHGHGARFTGACLDAVRREVEASDQLAGLCILHSAAGGTGSGLGTYLTEALRDEFPSTFLFNTVVCAHGSGEVILQHYNTLFTLSKLAQCSDGVLVVENEAASAVCRKLLHLERPSHTDLNRVICGALVGALAPTTSAPARTAGSESGGSWGGIREVSRSSSLHLGDKLGHLCANKDFIFLRASMVPQMPEKSKAFTRNTWQALVKRAHQIHITGALADINIEWHKKAVSGGGAAVGLNQSVASLLTFHGDSTHDAASAVGDSFRSRKLYPSWSSSPYLECYSPLRLQGHDRALTLLSNSQAVLGVLEATARTSRGMHSVGAYVHHLAKFGVESGDFEDAFLGIEQAVQNYRSLG